MQNLIFEQVGSFFELKTMGEGLDMLLDESRVTGTAKICNAAALAMKDTIYNAAVNIPAAALQNA